MILNQEILTNKGWKIAKDLTSDDIIFDKDGNQVSINKISVSKGEPCYKVYFDNNESIIVGENQAFLLYFLRKNNSSVVMRADELMEYMTKLTRRDSYKIPKIAINQPLKIDTIDLPIDPYVFGAWLGDGHKVDGKITNMYRELWDEIEKRGYALGEDVSQGGSGAAQTRSVFGLQTQLRELGVLGNKCIPDICLCSSYNQRLDILRGLMDTDGYYNPVRNRFVMCTGSEVQADYTLMLVNSLGVKATKIKAKAKCNGKLFDKYDVCWSSNELYPFLFRKFDIRRIKTTKRFYRNIVKVEKISNNDVLYIDVNSESKTFLTGKNLISLISL